MFLILETRKENTQNDNDNADMFRGDLDRLKPGICSSEHRADNTRSNHFHSISHRIRFAISINPTTQTANPKHKFFARSIHSFPREEDRRQGVVVEKVGRTTMKIGRGFCEGRDL